MSPAQGQCSVHMLQYEHFNQNFFLLTGCRNYELDIHMLTTNRFCSNLFEWVFAVAFGREITLCNATRTK